MKEDAEVLLLTSHPIINAKAFAKLSVGSEKTNICSASSFVIKLLFGKMGQKLVLEGQDVRPTRL